MVAGVVDFSLAGESVGADPVKLSVVLEDPLHLREKVGLVIIAGNLQFLAPVFAIERTRIPNVHEHQFVV